MLPCLEGAHRKFQGQSPQRGPYYNARPLIFNRHRIQIALWTVAGRNIRADTTQLIRLSLALEFSVLSLQRSGNRRFSKAKSPWAVRKASQRCKRFDLDSDGSLTQLELGGFLRSLGLNPSGEQIDALIKRVDTNNNGLIEFRELVSLIAPDVTAEVSNNQEQLMELFLSFDRNGNGYITVAELARSMAKMAHALSFRELTEMIAKADTDGDGRISFGEFTAAVTSSSLDYLKASLM